MAMKQTQTKLFDFSDVGLDFCAGSKNLFPDRFKKMLALGYNEQTVSNVAVSGNQVTFTYGGAHGYAADRVLKVGSGALAAINGGEFWIDSVTTNTVTMTIDGAPNSITGGFTTRISSLGWGLVYEQNNIHVYKLKALNESDLYLRLCFQNNASYRNRIAPCVGTSFDASTGYINDANSLNDTKQVMTPNLYAWDFSYNTGSTYDSYTYSQGYGAFGKGVVIGSLYHLAILHTSDTGSTMKIQAVLPSANIGLDAIKLPALVCEKYGNPSSTNSQPFPYLGKAVIGNTDCVFKVTTTNETTNNLDSYPQAYSSFLPNTIDGFNTTTTELIPLYVQENGQFIGYLYGIQRVKYAGSNAPAITKENLPLKTVEIDLSNQVYVHCLNVGGNNISYATYYAVPIEEIKIGT